LYIYAQDKQKTIKCENFWAEWLNVGEAMRKKRKNKHVTFNNFLSAADNTNNNKIL